MQTKRQAKPKTKAVKGNVTLKIKLRQPVRKLRVTVEGYVPPHKPKVVFEKCPSYERATESSSDAMVSKTLPKMIRRNEAVKLSIYADGQKIENVWAKILFNEQRGEPLKGKICCETFWPNRHHLHKDSAVTIKRSQIHAHMTNLTWLPSGFFEKK